MPEPLICEITRGTMVESRHRVHAVVVTEGGVAETWGDPGLMHYPRSAIKFIQALPFIESGAADAVKAGPAELALSAASHSGEHKHTATITAWLERMGMSADTLRCGAHLPFGDAAMHDFLRNGETMTRVHNNCSGKHAGFLATAQHLGENLDDYLEVDHPVQTRLFDLLSELSGETLDGTGRGIDGCGIPVYGMTLEGLARAAQKLAAPKGMGTVRTKAIERLLDAVTSHSFYVAGTGRFDTDFMAASKGRVATKIGAEGVHFAVDRKTGTGIALKAEDGAKRASDAAMGQLLIRMGMYEDTGDASMKRHLSPVILNAAGEEAGGVRIRFP